MFSIVTNACATDLPRLQVILPHWLDVFSERVTELVVIVDGAPPSGRIAALHAQQGLPPHDERLAAVRAFLDELSANDPRVIVREPSTPERRGEVAEKWFGRSDLEIVRCQAGTPIAVFLDAFEAASPSAEIVMRADCDMVFWDAGWLDEAAARLKAEKVDLVEPPHCSTDEGDVGVSTRALLIHKPRFDRDVLPIKPAKLDPLRTVHRALNKRPPWLALEQMLTRARDTGALRHEVLLPPLGASMHIIRAQEAALEIIPTVIEAVKSGNIPIEQRAAGWDFDQAAWEGVKRRSA